MRNKTERRGDGIAGQRDVAMVVAVVAKDANLRYGFTYTALREIGDEYGNPKSRMQGSSL